MTAVPVVLDVGNHTTTVTRPDTGSPDGCVAESFRTALLLDPRDGVTAWGDSAITHPDSTDPAALHQLLPSRLAGETDLRAMSVLTLFLTCVHGHVTGTAGGPADPQRAGVAGRFLVPPTWPARERALLRRAAARAGFGEDVPLLDPCDTAAAEYLATPAAPAPGSRFTVLDLGHGTIHAAGYEVTASGPARVAGPVGAPGPGVAADRVFLGALRDRLGPAVHRLLDDPATALDLLRGWDAVLAAERSWTGPRVPLPRALAEDREAGRLLAAAQGGVADAVVLTPEEVALMWDPIARAAVRLTGSLPPGPVVAVGGHARCDAVLALIGQAQPHPVHRLPGAVPAASRGALRAATAAGPGTVLGRTFGIAIDAPFEPGTDDPDRQAVDGYRIPRCRGRFAPLALRGDRLPPPGRGRVVEVGPLDPQATSVGVRVHATDRPQPPRYTDEPGVDHLVTIEVDVRATAGRSRDQRLFGVHLRADGAGVTVVAHDLRTGRELAGAVVGA